MDQRELFAQCGYGAVRVEDVAKAAGVSRTTFYNHFSNAPRPALLVLGGNTGGVELGTTLCTVLASDGYPTLNLLTVTGIPGTSPARTRAYVARASAGRRSDEARRHGHLARRRGRAPGRRQLPEPRPPG